MGSSGSNGRVERAIQSVQDQVTVMRVALQDRWKVDVSHRHAVFLWTLEYAAALVEPVRGGSRWTYGLRKAEGEEGQALGYGVRRNGSMANPPNREVVLLGSWTRCGTTVSFSESRGRWERS